MSSKKMGSLPACLDKRVPRVPEVVMWLAMVGALALSGTACGGGEGGGGDGGGGGGGECDCFERGTDSTTNTCDPTMLCDQILMICNIQEFTIEDCPISQLTTDSDAAIDCALDVLRAGKAGALDWRGENGETPGYISEKGSWMLVGDGTAYTWGSATIDVGAWVEPVVRVGLESPEYFQACADQPTAVERFLCLLGGKDPQAIETCIEGYNPY